MLSNDVTSFQNHLHALLANGNTRQAIADVLDWTKIHRPGWHREALLLSADFVQVSRDELRGIVSSEQSRLARNQIKDRLLQLTDRLADNPSVVSSFFKKHRKKLVTVPIAIGVLASIAEFSGYSVRDFFEKKPDQIVRPDSATKPAPTLQQTTHGANSPAIIAPDGDVNINYGGDEKKAEKDTLQ